jgi:hypothetical protein
MSLVGTLSDLSVDELLQLAALTRRSGVVTLHGESGTVWVGLRAGEIVRVARSEASASPQSPVQGREPPQPWMELLLELFEWERGEFSLESWVDPDVHWPGPEGVRVLPPLSPQFLALEGVRLGDESAAGIVPEPSLPAAAAPASPGRSASAGARAVIAIDSDPALLEQIKTAFGSGERPVHVFRRSDEGLLRLKQYLVRGIVPALVLGPDACDPLEPHRKPGWRALARRARTLAASIRVVLLSADTSLRDPAVSSVVSRPAASGATREELSAFLSRLADSLGLAA